MNQQCYLCNEKSTEWRTNFVKLHSKYTKTLYRDIFKRFLSEYSTQRNLDDASNQICLQCVTKIDDYDLILSTAAKKEIDLRNLLINTEQMFNCHSIKNDTAIPSPNDSLDDQRIHTKKLKSYKSKEKIIQSLKSNEYGIHKKNLAASSKNSSKVLTYNNVKNTPVKVMKPVTNIKILNSSTQQLKSLNNNLMVSNKLQSHDAKLQLIRTTYEKHMGKSKQDNPIAVSLRAPVEFRTKCLECNDNVWYNCYDYQVNSEEHLRIIKIMIIDYTFDVPIFVALFNQIKPFLQTHLHQTHLTCYLCNLTFTELKRSKVHAPL